MGEVGEKSSLVGLNASNLQTDFTKDLNFLTLRYGFDLRYDQVDSKAFLLNIETGSSSSEGQSSRYPSAGSSLLSGGIYAEANRNIGRNWQVRGGLRWSRQRLNARFGTNGPVAWPQAYIDGISNAKSAVTAALGLIRDTDNHRWRTPFAQGFRAPNIEDFAKFRESNGFVQVPNPTLQPERSNTLETGYRYVSRDNAFRAGATAYHTWLSNAIIRRDGTLPNGSRSFVSRGDTLFAQTNVNAESARVYGLDLDASLHFSDTWRVATALHLVRGRREQGEHRGGGGTVRSAALIMLLDGRGLPHALVHDAPGPSSGSPRRRVHEGGSNNGLLDAPALSSTEPVRLMV